MGLIPKSTMIFLISALIVSESSTIKVEFIERSVIVILRLLYHAYIFFHKRRHENRLMDKALEGWKMDKYFKWSGRVDGEKIERVHQIVKPFKPSGHVSEASKDQFALIGFCCDKGVERNKGRVGASGGPLAIRRELANLCLPSGKTIEIFDLGDINCEHGDLEKAQEELGYLVESSLAANLCPIILGGGHETAWGHFQGLQKFLDDKNFGIINFDAHFDLRPLMQGGLGSSGTPFTQIHQWMKSCGQDFNYLCLGLQAYANTSSLFTTAAKAKVDYVDAKMFNCYFMETVIEKVDAFLAERDVIYLSVCMDVFSSAFAPGVSSPQVRGIDPQDFQMIFERILASNKVCSFDIVELAPNYDLDGRSSKLAASIVMDYLMKSRT